MTLITSTSPIKFPCANKEVTNFQQLLISTEVGKSRESLLSLTKFHMPVHQLKRPFNSLTSHAILEPNMLNFFMPKKQLVKIKKKYLKPIKNNAKQENLPHFFSQNTVIKPNYSEIAIISVLNIDIYV